LFPSLLICPRTPSPVNLLMGLAEHLPDDQHINATTSLNAVRAAILYMRQRDTRRHFNENPFARCDNEQPGADDEPCKLVRSLALLSSQGVSVQSFITMLSEVLSTKGRKPTLADLEELRQQTANSAST